MAGSHGLAALAGSNVAALTAADVCTMRYAKARGVCHSFLWVHKANYDPLSSRRDPELEAYHSTYMKPASALIRSRLFSPQLTIGVTESNTVKGSHAYCTDPR